MDCGQFKKRVFYFLFGLSNCKQLGPKYLIISCKPNHQNIKLELIAYQLNICFTKLLYFFNFNFFPFPTFRVQQLPALPVSVLPGMYGNTGLEQLCNASLLGILGITFAEIPAIE